MITPGFAHTMARYNAWQNTAQYDAADTIGDEARRRDRGAFFGSIQRTMNHLLWGDTIWMSRFAAWDTPQVAIADSPNFVPDWEALKVARAKADKRILIWAEQLEEDDLEGEMVWFSGALGREVSKPLQLCLVHMFNHQTHHRGQIHAMLTAAGVRPGDTDLFVMPEEPI